MKSLRGKKRARTVSTIASLEQLATMVLMRSGCMWALTRFAPDPRMRNVLAMMEDRYRPMFLEKHLKAPWHDMSWASKHLGRCPQCEKQSCVGYVWDTSPLSVGPGAERDVMLNMYGGDLILRHKTTTACGNCWKTILKYQPNPCPSTGGFCGK